MATLTCNAGHGRRTLSVLAALAVLLALCAATALGGTGTELAAAAKAKTLGKTKRTPGPSCPGSRREACEAVGSVSGFQVRATGAKNPFKVRQNGKLVAWSVDLSRPKPSERRFFGKLYKDKSFGTSPAARISVIKPKQKKKYKLMRHSPAAELSEHYGETPIFTLDDPLRIRKGDVLALTLPTWIPAFAVDLPARKNRWRASRAGNACAIGTEGKRKKNLKKSKPQQKDGSTRSYGCGYRGARLLYWGYYTTGG